jgi:hypothetical protein
VKAGLVIHRMANADKLRTKEISDPTYRALGSVLEVLLAAVTGRYLALGLSTAEENQLNAILGEIATQPLQDLSHRDFQTARRILAAWAARRLEPEKGAYRP